MNIKAGVISGFTATVVLSILMVMKAGMGIMPELNVIKMLAGMMNASLAMGWVAHFTIGTVVWGVLFGALESKLPGGVMKSAIIFSIGAWILMMIGPLPMVGAGLFGLKMGMMAPVATLVLHLIWGAALGWTYKKVAG